MEKEWKCPRRDFLKKTAAGTVGLAASMSLLKPGEAQAAWPATGTMEINPNISNKRVVYCYDPAMVTNSNITSFTVATTNGAVNGAKIQSNMDLMAMQLAQQSTPALAWATIFQKPAAKTWAQVKVAIKVNLINSFNQPRIAVVEKIGRVLNGFGVPAANVIVYDGNPAGKNSNATQAKLWVPYFSTTDTTKIPGVVSLLNASLNGTVSAPTAGNTGNQLCTADIANGVIDILVNCAVNKGHSAYAGGVTLCLKNHFGTFTSLHNPDSNVPNNYLNYNKSDAIVGGTPVRQQLCIVDSLWADSNNNPDNAPTAVLSRLVMGTFAGIVDYLTVKNIRQAILTTQMGQPDRTVAAVANSFLTSFGYATTDTFEWVNASPTAVLPAAVVLQQLHSIELRVARGKAMTRFELPYTSGPLEIRIFDIRGRSVRKIYTELHGNHTVVSWDGKNDRGMSVTTGNYAVQVQGVLGVESGMIAVE